MQIIIDKNQLNLYNDILDFLEDIYIQKGPYEYNDSPEERRTDVILLNFTKIINDCRAVLLLAQSGYLIQAGIILRSTQDAMSLMMHIAFYPVDTELLEKWKTNQKVRHYDVFRKLNRFFKEGLNKSNYVKSRKKLDDWVHGNFQGVKLYPYQAEGPTPIDDVIDELTFWRPLLYLDILSCLLCVQLIEPDKKNESEMLLNKLQKLGW